MAVEKPGKLREFFLLLCGHPAVASAICDVEGTLYLYGGLSFCLFIIQCFDTVGWATGRASGHVKTSRSKTPCMRIKGNRLTQVFLDHGH